MEHPNRIFECGFADQVFRKLKLGDLPNYKWQNTWISTHRYGLPSSCSNGMLHELAHIVEMEPRPFRWQKITTENNLGFGSIPDYGLWGPKRIPEDRKLRHSLMEARTVAIQRRMAEEGGEPRGNYDQWRARTAAVFDEVYELSPGAVREIRAAFDSTYKATSWDQIHASLVRFGIEHMPRLYNTPREEVRFGKPS